MHAAERALIELVTEARARLESAEVDVLAGDPRFVEGFEARLREHVFVGGDAPDPALLAALERAAAPLRVLAADSRFDRFAHWPRYASLARLEHAIALGLDELRYARAIAEHDDPCDCAIVATLVAQRRGPRSDRLQRVDDDDDDGSDSFVVRARYVCGHCGSVWEWSSSDYPGDPIGGESWSKR